MYSVKLIPNHKDLNATLIGLTEYPSELVKEWLETRPQFVMTKVKGRECTWKGHATNMRWSTPGNMNGYEYARDQNDASHTITATKLGESTELNLAIPYGSDAFHLL